MACALGIMMPPMFVLVSSLASRRVVLPPTWLVTPLDARIRVVPLAVWAYVSWYPASLVLLCADRNSFRALCSAEFTAFLVCSLVHLMWPVTIERPSVGEMAGVSARALGLVYAMDKPVSLFPSFHAAVAPILLSSRPTSRLWRTLMWAWMASICFSCVLTKQHYLLDVIAGLCVGLLSVAFGYAVFGTTVTQRAVYEGLDGAPGRIAE